MDILWSEDKGPVAVFRMMQNDGFEYLIDKF